MYILYHILHYMRVAQNIIDSGPLPYIHSPKKSCIQYERRIYASGRVRIYHVLNSLHYSVPYYTIHYILLIILYYSILYYVTLYLR